MLGIHSIQFEARSHFRGRAEPLDVEIQLIVAGEPGSQTLNTQWRIRGATGERVISWKLHWVDLGALDLAMIGTAIRRMIIQRKGILDLRKKVDVGEYMGPGG